MKHKELIGQMTLEEKCGLLTGRDIWSTKPIERLGIQSIFLSDGPSGLRKQLGEADHLGLNASQPATCWPSAAAIAASWNEELAASVGEHLGAEAVSQGVSVVLGPGLNTKRSSLCGRNFEYFSEDPYLSGKMAAGFIQGIQSHGIAACPKHFAANSQELRRMASDSVIDERTLREMYLTNFEIAVTEGKPKSIMSSYNLINGVYTNEDEHLLREILVDDWGFDGAVVTDWGGSNDHVEGVRAGSHLEMPGTGGDSDRQLVEAVKSGRIAENLIDQRVDEILGLIMTTQLAGCEKTENFDIESHHTMAVKAAEESIVLLKNENKILPLKANTKVAIIGDFAQTPRYQGAGSSAVNPTKLENLLEVFGHFDLEKVGYAQGFARDGSDDHRLTKEAVGLAKKAEVVLLCMGLPEIYETEGMDRSHIGIPENQVKLLHKIQEANSKIVVVFSAGCNVEMWWAKEAQGLLYAGLGGQAGARAILNVVTGKVNPSGKLAETFAASYEDAPVSKYFHQHQKSAEYRESLYIGYRYFETVHKAVAFPFGYGLSYTNFEYENLSVTPTKASFTLKNIGEVAGAEVAQLYIGCEDSKVFRPAKELKGFAKVFLEPGESKKVTIALDDKAFRYFNVKTNSWEIEHGTYSVMIGASVSDIKLVESIDIQGTGATSPYNPETLKSYYSGHVEKVTTEEFEQLLGHKAPEPNWDTKAPLGMNDTLSQMYYAKSWVARLAYKVLTYMKDRSIAKGKPDLNILFIYNMPFRGLAKMTGGRVSMRMAETILSIVNGRFVRTKWQGFTKNHPNMGQFLMFFLLSNGVTLLQMLLMPVFKGFLSATNMVDINLQVWQVGNNLDGSPYYMFNYAEGSLASGGGGGLAYFLSVQITMAIAQIINFFLQRNVTFKSKSNIKKAAIWYTFAYIIITMVAALAQGLYKTPIYDLLMNTWGMGATGETIADFVTMIINAAISFWVFFPIFKVIFREKK